VAVGHDVVANRLGRRAASAAGFAAAAAVLGIARGAGISWAELGLGRDELSSGVRTGAIAAAGAAGAVFAGAALPGTRSFFLDERAAADRNGGLAAELARIAFVAVPAEELTYRSALLDLRLGCGGRPGAVAWSSLLFGLSHVLPTLSTMSHTALGCHLAQRPQRQAAFVVGNVAVTGLAGAVFAWLRLRSGSVVAPLLAHAALNSSALLAGRLAYGLADRWPNAASRWPGTPGAVSPMRCWRRDRCQLAPPVRVPSRVG
jgi:membrane protease YdiL (CAAX protease family)